jgi:glutaredoxin-related protein
VKQLKDMALGKEVKGSTMVQNEMLEWVENHPNVKLVISMNDQYPFFEQWVRGVGKAKLEAVLAKDENGRISYLTQVAAKASFRGWAQQLKLDVVDKAAQYSHNDAT